MIVTPLDGTGRTAIVTQTDHARLSAEILSLWRADGLPEHPYRDDLLFAAREHDNGWAESDSAPRVAKDGRPHDFMTVPTPVRQEIWHRGVLRHAESRPLAALWITLHALHLHRRHGPKDEWRESFDRWRRLERELRDAVDVPDEVIDDGYRFIDLSDTVSLAACARWSRKVSLRGMEIDPRAGEGSLFAEVGLEPLPLAGSTVFEVGARTLDRRTFSGDSDLALALASARWIRLRVRVVPGVSSGIG